MAIVTLADAKKQLNIDPGETGDDVELQGFVDAATAAVETQLGQVVDPRTIVEQVSLQMGLSSFLLRSVPVISLTSITSLDGSTTWNVGQMRVDGPSGLVTVLSGPLVSGTAVVTYQAGMVPVQANVQLAAKIIIQHLWETQRGTMGVQLGGDQDTYVAGRGFAIPRRAIELLGSQLPGVA